MEINMTKRYGISDIWTAADLPVGERHRQSRRIATALNRLMDHLIRIDADEQQLSDFADRFEALEQDLAQFNRLDSAQMFSRFMQGEGSSEDVMNVVDLDAYRRRRQANPRGRWVTVHDGAASHPLETAADRIRSATETIEAATAQIRAVRKGAQCQK